MEEKYIKEYINILNYWGQKNKAGEATLYSSDLIKVPLDKKIPAPLEYFVYWFMKVGGYSSINIEINEIYTLNFLPRSDHEIRLSLYNHKEKKLENITLRYINFDKDNLISDINKKLQNFNISTYIVDADRNTKTELIIDYPSISSRFSKGRKIFNKLNEDEIIKEISSLYELSVFESDFSELKYIINTEQIDDSKISLGLTSTKRVTNNYTAMIIQDEKKYNNNIIRLLNKYLKFINLTGRVYKIRFEYLYTLQKKLKIWINMTIRLYDNEEYYGSYGFYETAIENICKKSLGSSHREIKKISKQLFVDIKGLDDDEICAALWQRFYDLNDKDFD